MTILNTQQTVQTKQTAERAHKCARGSWQRGIIDDMLVGGCTNPVAQLRGKAKDYSGRYQESFDNLLDRLQSAGITVHKQLGPRGGEFSAVFTIQ